MFLVQVHTYMPFLKNLISLECDWDKLNKATSYFSPYDLKFCSACTPHWNIWQNMKKILIPTCISGCKNPILDTRSTTLSIRVNIYATWWSCKFLLLLGTWGRCNNNCPVHGNWWSFFKFKRGAF